MKFFKLIIIYLWTTSLISCSSESPFVSKDVVDEIIASRNPFRYIGNIAAIIDNDIYYFHHIDSLPQRITSSPQEIKTDLKLSQDNQKMAYLNENRSPVIINAQGDILETLSEYSSVKQFGWTNNDQSLYFLIGNEIFIHGVKVSVRQPELQHFYDQVLSYSRNEKGDEAYIIYQYMGFAGQSGNRLKFYSPENNIDTLISVMNNEFYDMGFVEFCGDNGEFLLGYEGSKNRISKVYCHDSYDFWAQKYWEYDYINSPVYNPEYEMLMMGSISQPYLLEAIYLGADYYRGDGVHDVMKKHIGDISSLDNPVYVDWNQ